MAREQKKPGLWESFRTGARRFIDSQNQEWRDFKDNLREPGQWDDAAGQALRAGALGPYGMAAGYALDWWNNRGGGFDPQEFNDYAQGNFDDRMAVDLWGDFGGHARYADAETQAGLDAFLQELNDSFEGNLQERLARDADAAEGGARTTGSSSRGTGSLGQHAGVVSNYDSDGNYTGAAVNFARGLATNITGSSGTHILNKFGRMIAK